MKTGYRIRSLELSQCHLGTRVTLIVMEQSPAAPGGSYGLRAARQQHHARNAGRRPGSCWGGREAAAKNAPCPGTAVPLNRCCLVSRCARKCHILLWAHRNTSQIEDLATGILSTRQSIGDKKHPEPRFLYPLASVCG